MKELKKTRLVDDIKMRALEEFAEEWPRMLNTVDQSALRRMGVSMPIMVDVFRSVWQRAFCAGATIQLRELIAEGVFHGGQPFPREREEAPGS